MTNELVYVIMPVYNEGRVVTTTVRKVKSHFSNVICVNDGSSDDSESKAVTAGATVVNHPINLGAGAATQTGIDFALQDKSAKYFVTIDADGQHDPADAVKMLGYLKKHDLDIVLGSRFMGASKNMTMLKKVLLGGARLVSRVDSGIGLTDPHIGLRVFNRNFAENLNITMPDFAHASEVVHRIKEGGYAYGEVPVIVTYSEYSKAKGQPMLNAINIAFDLLLQRAGRK